MATPTVFNANEVYGITDESTATGIYAASMTDTLSTEMAQARDHNGYTVAFSLYEEKLDITLDGVLKTPATFVGIAAGDVITLQNSTTFDSVLGTTIVTGGSLTRSNTDFQSGSLSLVNFTSITVP